MSRQPLGFVKKRKSVYKKGRGNKTKIVGVLHTINNPFTSD
jgi:hypothetical protein